MDGQKLDMLVINQTYIDFSLRNMSAYSNFIKVQYLNEEVDCLVVCYQGQLSLSVGDDIKYNRWTMTNWVSKNRDIWEILSQILTQEDMLMYAMNRNNLPYHFVYRKAAPTQTVVFLRRHGKNYVFINSDVYISRNFVEWIQKKNISIPISYNKGYYIRK